MRLCLNDSLVRLPFSEETEKRVKIVHDIGFRVSGLIIDPEATDDDIKRTQDVFAKYDMAFGSASGWSYFNPDPAVRRERVDKMKKFLKVAGKAGCPTFRVAGGSMSPKNVWMHHPENHTHKAMDLFVEATRELAPYAEDAGVCICPETTQWTIIGSPERMKLFVDRCESDYVKVILDFVNQTRPEDIYKTGEFALKTVGELGDRIGVFHVKDVMVQDSHLVVHIDETPVGTGLLDHDAIIKASTLLEPWKTFSMEHFNQKDVPRETQWQRGFDHIQEHARNMGHVWTGQHLTREKWAQGVKR